MAVPSAGDRFAGYSATASIGATAVSPTTLYSLRENAGTVETCLPIQLLSRSGPTASSTRCFVTETHRKLRLIEILSVIKHRLRTVQPNRLHLQSDLTWSRLLQRPSSNFSTSGPPVS